MYNKLNLSLFIIANTLDITYNICIKDNIDNYIHMQKLVLQTHTYTNTHTLAQTLPRHLEEVFVLMKFSVELTARGRSGHARLAHRT